MNHRDSALWQRLRANVGVCVGIDPKQHTDGVWRQIAHLERYTTARVRSDSAVSANPGRKGKDTNA